MGLLDRMRNSGEDPEVRRQIRQNEIKNYAIRRQVEKMSPYYQNSLYSRYLDPEDYVFDHRDNEDDWNGINYEDEENPYEDEENPYEDEENPYGDDENEDGWGEEYKSPQEMIEDEENAENDSDDSEDDDGEGKKDKKKKNKKNRNGVNQNEEGTEIKGGIRSKKLNKRKMIAEAKNLKALPIPYPRDCPFCKQRSLFYEPLAPAMIRKILSYILKSITFGAAPIRKTRYVCLNPKCKAYYPKYGTRFIDNPIDFGGAVIPSHLLDTPQNSFRLKDNYR